ncbi:hypothetical protein NE686_17330 [Tissierella carlieri]|uniref:Uncharacterized protein n=1 Tax=Tissierella carlieri TaxID=689904 RepID=A0ABT1SEG1_9FIRM|nr:hypothetical protein [Tissierella carlieri]MCQ4924868.1 hypothetical protein [Tissierella carlieri]
MEKSRKYFNRKSNEILKIKEEDIREEIRVVDMLKVPKNVKSITDKNIEYIRDVTYETKELDQYLLIAEEDLTFALKVLYDCYRGDIFSFLCGFRKSKELKEVDVMRKLNEELEENMSKAIKPSLIIPQFTFNGIVLVNPKLPDYEEEWQLLEIS